MTITPKTITIVLLVSYLLVASWMIVNKRKTLPTSAPNEPVQYETNEQSEDNVTVTVTPLILKREEPTVFQLVFETHSVDLSFDVSTITTLTDDKGTLYGAPVWSGSPPGGHHRKGTLLFPTPIKQATSITLTLRDIAGVAKRTFTWNL